MFIGMRCLVFFRVTLMEITLVLNLHGLCNKIDQSIFNHLMDLAFILNVSYRPKMYVI